MRLADAVVVNVNSQAVSVSGNTLTVNLSGSNALQVAGASYSVTFSAAGLVQDNLGNTLAARTDTAGIKTNGVTRPYVRIKKSQDTISRQTAGNNTALYTAEQPQRSEARMDCRTPGSTVIYRYQSRVTNVSARNWGAGDNTPNNAAAVDDANNPDPARLGDPRTVTTANNNTTATYSAPFTLPIMVNGAYEQDTNTTRTNVTDYQGYQWLVKAVGRTGNAGSYSYSEDSEEIAYRTVLTYEVNGMGNSGTYGDSLTRNPTTGAQVWIRGGDAIGSSTTPGFPLTWADDWSSAPSGKPVLSGKRAGIRLMTKTNAGTNHGNNPTTLNNSTWQFVTWEINVPAYFDMIKGNNLTNTGATQTVDEAITWQYGPREWAYQRDGWTSFKEQYPMFPGKHRWLYVDGNDSFANKGRVNFSNTFSSRRTFTATEGWTSPNTNSAAPQ